MYGLLEFLEGGQSVTDSALSVLFLALHTLRVTVWWSLKSLKVCTSELPMCHSEVEHFEIGAHDQNKNEL